MSIEIGIICAAEGQLMSMDSIYFNGECSNVYDSKFIFAKQGSVWYWPKI